MARIERNMRQVMSTLAFWVVIAYFILVFTVVALVVLFNRTAQEQASRAATARSTAETQVAQCFTSVKNAPVTDGFIDSHEAIIQNSLIANRAAVELAPRNDPLRPVRLRSITRLEAAQKNVVQLRKLVAETTPTKKKCLTLARTLSVDPSRYTNQVKEKP